MFPSQQLISYVFANPGDEYRGSDLLTLNLEQYLWKSLHKDYNTVYYLKNLENRTFRAHTFGDRGAAVYDPPFFKSNEEKAFGKWLLEQLCREREKAVAFVCPLDDFCQIFSRPAWEPYLEKIANAPNRTGIFVLTASPYAEDSQKHLLESPVFDRLCERVITENRDRNREHNRCIYADIQEYKSKHYRCLNVFTAKRINDLLLHICAEDPARCMDEGARRSFAKTLTEHLQSGKPLPGILQPSQPSRYLTYRELYNLLLDRRVWEAARQLPPLYTESRVPPILRSPDSYAGKCLRQQLPEWALAQTNSVGVYPEHILERIQEIAQYPSNCPENPKLARQACDFLQEIRNLEKGDIDTCTLLLDALKFCIRWITVCDENDDYQDIQDILKLYTLYSKSSAELFQREQKLLRWESDPYATCDSIAGQQVQESRRTLDEEKRDHSECVDFLRNAIIKMETYGKISGILKDRLYEEMQKTEVSRPSEPDIPNYTYNPAYSYKNYY